MTKRNYSTAQQSSHPGFLPIRAKEAARSRPKKALEVIQRRLSNISTPLAKNQKAFYFRPRSRKFCGATHETQTLFVLGSSTALASKTSRTFPTKEDIEKGFLQNRKLRRHLIAACIFGIAGHEQDFHVRPDRSSAWLPIPGRSSWASPCLSASDGSCPACRPTTSRASNPSLASNTTYPLTFKKFAGQPRERLLRPRQQESPRCLLPLPKAFGSSLPCVTRFAGGREINFKRGPFSNFAFDPDVTRHSV